jgi:hypothetical protein
MQHFPHSSLVFPDAIIIAGQLLLLAATVGAAVAVVVDEEEDEDEEENGEEEEASCGQSCKTRSLVQRSRVSGVFASSWPIQSCGW